MQPVPYSWNGSGARAAQQARIKAVLSENRLIAIIDDDPSVAKATGSIVRSLGFESLIFTSAADFLACARRAQVGCIVCDVQMPGMSGIDLYEVLIAEGSQIPVIFITAFAGDWVRQRVGEAACVLHKPFEASALVACLSEAM
jgi:FixJ family two-component response regulator